MRSPALRWEEGATRSAPGWLRSWQSRRRGLSVVELIIIVAVAAFFGLIVLTLLPRGRESARLTGCQRNMMQIGMGLQLYLQANRHFPESPPLDQAGDSYLRAMLDALTLSDFLDLRDPTVPPKTGPVPAAGARVPGLVCPSDPMVGVGSSFSGSSYRANAGDSTDGSTGPFTPGLSVTPARVEAANGLSFTAGLAERLLGSGRAGEAGPMNYQVAPGPVLGSCPTASTDQATWRGDLGASWAESGWRSGLYSHAQVPNAPLTCLASDGQTANITASSSHPERINVGLLDGSLRAVKPTIDPTVWRRLGSIRIIADDASSPTP